MRLGQNSFVTSAITTLDATGVKLTFAPAIPCRLVRFGATVTTLVDNATPLVMQLDTNDVVVAPVNTLRWTLTAPSTVDFVIGAVVSRAPAQDSSDDFNLLVGLDKNIIIPGSNATVEVSTAATAGDGYVWIEYTPLSWTNIFQVGASSVHSPIEVTS